MLLKLLGRVRTARGLAIIDFLITLAVGVMLTVQYTVVYLADRARPGNSSIYPKGWLGWFDQSMMLRSTAALAQGSLDPMQHHYALGYSLLGLPFYLVSPQHPFFAIDALSLLVAFGGFIALGRRLNLSGAVSAVLFACSTMSAPILFRQWVLPWNTTPVAACLWLLLATVAAWLDGRRRPGSVGLLMGLVVVCRPSDAVILLPCVGALVWVERHNWQRGLAAAARVATGAAVVVVPVVALHVAIYGWAESPYMASSARIGFTLSHFAWKSYVLFVDPFPWFAEGEGVLQRSHWVALGLMGLLAALVRGLKDRVLALTLIVHAVLYISYVDLLPFGLWRFNNIHYFAWAYPGYALMAGLLAKELIRPRVAWTRWTGLGAIAAMVIVLCIRITPSPAKAGQPAKVVDFTGDMPPFLETVFLASLQLRDADGSLTYWRDFRAYPYPGGVRVYAMRRDMVGAVEWVPGHAPTGFEGATATARWVPRMRLIWPPIWLLPAHPPANSFPLD